MEKILPGIINEYQPKDIFTADEIGLFNHLMPKLLAYEGKKCKGGGGINIALLCAFV